MALSYQWGLLHPSPPLASVDNAAHWASSRRSLPVVLPLSPGAGCCGRVSKCRGLWEQRWLLAERGAPRAVPSQLQALSIPGPARCFIARFQALAGADVVPEAARSSWLLASEMRDLSPLDSWAGVGNRRAGVSLRFLGYFSFPHSSLLPPPPWCFPPSSQFPYKRRLVCPAS